MSLSVVRSSYSALWPYFCGFSLLVAECAAGVYAAVVLWNPDIVELVGIAGESGNSAPSIGTNNVDRRSPAGKNCAFDPANPVDWDALAAAASASESESGQPWQRSTGDAGKTWAVDAGLFYEEYHGHPLRELCRVYRGLRAGGCSRFIFFAGDSSLDNKHWFFDGFALKRDQLYNPGFTAPALNGYERILNPPRMVMDVSYHLNRLAQERYGPKQVCTLMTAVEESSLEDRARNPGLLLAHDAFIRDHISNDDVLVVSVGGNDIALRPTLRTAVNMFLLTHSPVALIDLGLAPGFGYFTNLFHARIQEWVTRLVEKAPPRKVIICMIYYPDEHSSGGRSWADIPLNAMGYDDNPEKLQLIIRTLFSTIQKRGFGIPGVADIEAFPLFEVMDGKHTEDYVQRVEPSVIGGRKMAEALLESL